MDRVWHPVDLPAGLPHGAPGAEPPEAIAGPHRGLPPGRRAVGLRQIDGMPHEPQRARSVAVGHSSPRRSMAGKLLTKNQMFGSR